MDKNKEKIKQIIKFGAIVVFLACLYFTGMVFGLLRYHKACYSPITILKCFVEFGFPMRMFLIFFTVFGLAFVCGIFAYMQQLQGMDKMGRMFKMAQGRQTYGDSHFEDPEEFKDVALVQPPEKAYGTILGQLDMSGQKLINYKMHDNRLGRHMTVLGGTGSGKSYTMTIPFCYQVVKRRESAIITDPDGGLYRDVAGYFQDNGYVVRRLDFANLLRSDGWNCLKSIHEESAELDAQIFAQTIISNLVDDMSSIYAVGPMSLLKALLLYVVLDPDRAQEDKNIGEVYKLLQNPGGEDFLDSIFDVSQLSEAQMPALGPYLSFKTASPNLRGNLITNLATQLQLFQNKLVCEVLSTDDIDLLLPGVQPCAYFCIFPDYHYTYQFLVSLFFSMLFMNLTQFADNQPNGMLPIPVNFLLDEFRAIGKLPDWDTKMATIRKRGMSAIMIFQDVTQLQMKYEKDWENILGNCSTLVCLGINAPTTADMVSKRVGETSVEVQTKQSQTAVTLSCLNKFASHNTGEGRRALLSTEELYRMDKDDSLIIFQGHNPIWAKKYPHILHPESKKLRTILPQDIPSIKDKDARAAAREEEKRRVAAYIKEHPLSAVDRSYASVCEYEPEETRITKLRKTINQEKRSLQKIIGIIENKFDGWIENKNDRQRQDFIDFELIDSAPTFEIESSFFVTDAEGMSLETEDVSAVDKTIVFEIPATVSDAKKETRHSHPEELENAHPVQADHAEESGQRPKPKLPSTTPRYRFISDNEETVDVDGGLPPGKRSH